MLCRPWPRRRTTGSLERIHAPVPEKEPNHSAVAAPNLRLPNSGVLHLPFQSFHLSFFHPHPWQVSVASHQMARLESQGFRDWCRLLKPIKIDIVSDFSGRGLFAIHGEALLLYCLKRAKVDFDCTLAPISLSHARLLSSLDRADHLPSPSCAHQMASSCCMLCMPSRPFCPS